MLKKGIHGLLLAAALVLAGCGDDDTSGLGNGGVTPPGDEGCTVEDRNAAVYSVMTDWYYWYKEVPEVDPVNYESPQALLDAIRYREFDETFTYLTTVEEEQAFLENAAYIGFGFSSVVVDNGLFLRESFEGGPAHAAGMQRGDEITAIDGEDVSTLLASGQLSAALGPREIGYTAEFDVRHPDGTTGTYTVTKEEVTTPVVNEVVTDLAVGKDTSYLFFRSFVNPAYDALDSAFAKIKDAGDTKLVLDLRYNGGGLVDVAEHLAGLVAGSENAGEELGTMKFNDRHSEENILLLIEAVQNSAEISELVVITTEATASASELLVNGLKVHMPVATVGSNTYGKPVGQSRFDFCENDILRAVTFKTVNANDEGDYFGGIAPTCAAEDDILDPLGDVDEASLAEAIYYLESDGSCSASASNAAATLARKQGAFRDLHPLVRDGHDILTGGAQ